MHSLLQDDNYLYVGTQESPGHVIKINKADMSRESTLTLDAGENLVAAMAQSSEFLFVLLNPTSGPARLVKVRKQGLARIGEFAFSSLASAFEGEFEPLPVALQAGA